MRKRSMQPFCKVVTPRSSELADNRKRVMAVSMLTSSKLGRDSSGDEGRGARGWTRMTERGNKNLQHNYHFECKFSAQFTGRQDTIKQPGKFLSSGPNLI